MPIPSEIESLLKAKKFEEIEARWSAIEEIDPPDVDALLPIAQALKGAGEKKRAASLLGLLAESLGERGLWGVRLYVIEETVRLFSALVPPDELRSRIRACLENLFPANSGLDPLLERFGFFAATSAQAVVEASEKARRWIPYSVGSFFYIPDHGAGRVVDLNFTLGNVKLDFERRKGVSIPIGATTKFLVPLPPGHILREWLENPAAVRELLEKKPIELFRRVVESFGRPLTTTEVKAALAGPVPEAKWSRFWGIVQKHPQVAHSGKGKLAAYGWSESADAASDQIRKDFESANLERRLELARKHFRRSADLVGVFARVLAEEAEARRDREPALTFEILQTIERLPVTWPLGWGSSELLAEVDPGVLLAPIRDRSLREKALTLFRDARPADWPSIWREAFLKEDDPRTLSRMAEALEEKAPDSYKALIEDILRFPRRHPARFLWYCEKAQTESGEGAALPPRADLPLLAQLFSALEWEDFVTYRPRLRALFERGGLALRIIQSLENEDQGVQVLGNLPKVVGLEASRKALLEEAVFRRFPTLRAKDVDEELFATADSVETKRRELEHLIRVEIPANGKAIQEAVALGDLSENFEYKSAKQKQVYLNARVGKLTAELNRVRILDPATVDTTEARIGTRLRLRGEGGRRFITLLGPWESDPEKWIVSYQSDLGSGLLGKKPGDSVRIGEENFEIDSIEVWTMPPE